MQWPRLLPGKRCPWIFRPSVNITLGKVRERGFEEAAFYRWMTGR